jgi:hypothetical protein
MKSVFVLAQTRHTWRNQPAVACFIAGFTRFSEDSAYRRRPAKLAAKHLIPADSAELQPPAVRALDFGSRSTSGGASPTALSPAPSMTSPSPVATTTSSSPAAGAHSRSPAAGGSGAAFAAFASWTPFGARFPRPQAAAGTHPAAAAARPRRPAIPPLRLDKLAPPVRPAVCAGWSRSVCLQCKAFCHGCVQPLHGSTLLSCKECQEHC